MCAAQVFRVPNRCPSRGTAKSDQLEKPGENPRISGAQGKVNAGRESLKKACGSGKGRRVREKGKEIKIGKGLCHRGGCSRDPVREGKGGRSMGQEGNKTDVSWKNGVVPVQAKGRGRRDIMVGQDK